MWQVVACRPAPRGLIKRQEKFRNSAFAECTCVRYLAHMISMLHSPRYRIRYCSKFRWFNDIQSCRRHFSQQKAWVSQTFGDQRSTQLSGTPAKTVTGFSSGECVKQKNSVSKKQNITFMSNITLHLHKKTVHSVVNLYQKRITMEKIQVPPNLKPNVSLHVLSSLQW